MGANLDKRDCDALLGGSTITNNIRITEMRYINECELEYQLKGTHASIPVSKDSSFFFASNQLAVICAYCARPATLFDADTGGPYNATALCIFTSLVGLSSPSVATRPIRCITPIPE